MEGYTLLEKSAPPYDLKGGSSTFETPSAPVIQDDPMPQMPQLLPVPGYRPSLIPANPNVSHSNHMLETTPIRAVCPHCRLHVESRVTCKPGREAHIFAGCLCVFCLWCFIWLPYVLQSFLKAKHYCRSCGGLIGTYNG